MGIIKITIYQKSFQEGLNLSIYKRLSSVKSDYLLFPEYFYIDPSVKDKDVLIDKSTYALDWLLKLNDTYKGVIIGGSMVYREEDKLYNAVPIIANGAIVDWYKKQRLTEFESGFLTAGTEPGIFILGGRRFAVLLSEDIHDPTMFKTLHDQGIHLIFLLKTTKNRGMSEEELMVEDEKYLVEPSKEFNQYIVRCNSTGSFMDQALLGRSMAITPRGISWKVAPHEQNDEIVKTLMLNVPNS